MHKGHAILGALVAAAALWAYLVAHPTGGGSASTQAAVPVWDVPLRAVQSLSFQDGAVHTVLRPRWEQGDRKPYVWIESDGPQAHPRTAPGAPPPEPEPARVEFKGSAAAGQMLETFAALNAQRDLGRLEALDAEALGLISPTASLELQREGGPPLKLELGRVTYGDTGRYAHRLDNGHVYVLPTAELRRLSAAQPSLMDRELLGPEIKEATRVEVSADGQTRTFHRLVQPTNWGTAPDATQPLANVATLLNGVQRMAVMRYRAGAAASEAGSAPAVAPDLEVRYFEGDGAEPKGWVRFHLEGEQGAWAVSSHTRNPVEQVAQGVRELLNKARSALKGT